MAGAVNARLLYFLYRNKRKDFDYEKTTLVIAEFNLQMQQNSD